jgi:hypothetical protein
VTRVAGWLASALVVALVITPVTYNAVKFALVAPVALGALLAICARGGRLRLHPYVLLWFAFYVALGAFFVTRGFLSDAPGTLYLAAIYVAFPLLYGLLVEGAHDLGVLRRVSSAAVVGGMLTCAYMFYYALWALGVVPRALFFRLDRTQNIGIAGGMVQMRLYAISGLVFLVPYVVASLVVTPPGEAGPLRRRWLWLAFVLGAAGTLLSGRKALMLTVAATPLVVVALRRLLPPAERARSARSYRRFVVTGGALLAAAAVYLPATGRFDWGAIASMIGSGFDVEGDVGAGERYKQARELVAAWTAHPLLGWGWGHGAPGFLRSDDRPWEYELQYVLLLFSTGLVGWVLYAAGVVWVYWTGARVIRSGAPHARDMVPALTGLTGALLANATNPYLVSGGNMWMVFFPIALINSWLLRQTVGVSEADGGASDRDVGGRA